MIIGIVGASGSGKSTLARHLTDLRPNLVHLNVDCIGHKANETENVKTELRKYFGEFIFTEGKVDRKKLGSIVFNSEEAMQKLKEITWGEMKKMIDEYLTENKAKDIILDWALLPNTEYFKLCDITILVDVPYEIRLERVVSRDGITEQKFKERESKGLDYRKYDFDFVIENIDYECAKEKVRNIA
jgi:dephospho-CoA kinase